LLTHCETLKTLIAEVERLSVRLLEAADREALPALIHTAHRIAGTGGTMGFDAVAQKAFALETFAKQHERRPRTGGEAMIHTLTRSLMSAGADLRPEQSRLRQKLLMRG
jgi:hypothetical protein